MVKELGHALLTVGLPLHSVQHYMDMSAKRFGLHLHICTIGNSIWAAFGCDSTCHLIQVSNPGNHYIYVFICEPVHDTHGALLTCVDLSIYSDVTE